jgi:hypothetical protein
MIARSPASQVAPGSTYTLSIAFRPIHPVQVEDGAWARASLLFWTSSSLAHLKPGVRFGKDVVDAGFSQHDDTSKDLDQAIRVDLAVPFVPASDADRAPAGPAKAHAAGKRAQASEDAK